MITINMNNAALCRLEQQAAARLPAAPARERTQPGGFRLDVEGLTTEPALPSPSPVGPSAPPRQVMTTVA